LYTKGIGIIESILGKQNTEYAIPSGHLAHVHSHYLHSFKVAEKILLSTKRMCKLQSVNRFHIILPKKYLILL